MTDADTIATLRAQLDSTLKDRALIIADRDRTFALMLTRAEAEKARADAAVKLLGRAQRALKPFADRVFNDNGDCTISDTHTLTPSDYWNAQEVERMARAAIGGAA